MSRMLPESEFGLRITKLQQEICENGFDAILISTNVNIYYVSGVVFNGYVYVPAEGNAVFFVRRPVGMEDCRVVYVRKPEQIVDELQRLGMPMPERLAFELDRISYAEAMRLAKAFGRKELLDCSPMIAMVRSVKTPYEIARLRESGARHAMAYRHIPGIFRTGMRDYEFQVELEHILRVNGCLGLFRINGNSMEEFMGSVLTGENADAPSPYDFALGGEGMDGSLPMGCNGSIIASGTTLMVDMNGNFNGYMTDLTRTYYVNRLDERAKKAHELSIAINHDLANFVRPGVAAKDVYDRAMQMVKDAGMEEYYMGYTQKAGFMGHGVGIEINEWPVLAPRSRHVMEKGNVIAIEPKFVIPGVGAVGIENTYAVGDTGLECLTDHPEELMQLGV